MLLKAKLQGNFSSAMVKGIATWQENRLIEIPHTSTFNKVLPTFVCFLWQICFQLAWKRWNLTCYHKQKWNWRCRFWSISVPTPILQGTQKSDNTKPCVWGGEAILGVASEGKCPFLSRRCTSDHVICMISPLSFSEPQSPLVSRVAWPSWGNLRNSCTRKADGKLCFENFHPFYIQDATRCSLFHPIGEIKFFRNMFLINLLIWYHDLRGPSWPKQKPLVILVPGSLYPLQPLVYPCWGVRTSRR